MNKTKIFKNMRFLITVIAVSALSVFILKEFFQIFKWLFFFLIGNIFTKYYWKIVVDMCNVTRIRFINAVFFYVVLHMLVTITFYIISLIIMLVIAGLEHCINQIDIIVLGSKHEKSLDYPGITLWYIKFKADFLFFCDWIRNDVLKVRYIIKENDTKIKWVRKLSVESIITGIKQVIVFFFDFTFKHLFLAIISLYTFYNNDILLMWEWAVKSILQNKATLSQFLEIVESFTTLCLFACIVFDIRHKVSGYFTLRAERFKELIQMEEKLMTIIVEIIYSLEQNIDTIAESKWCILQSGVSYMTGKRCYNNRGRIEFWDNKMGCIQHDDKVSLFSNLNEMEEEFLKLLELEQDIKKSTIRYSNIYLVDHKAMLTKVIHFLNPSLNDKKYQRMKFFCKSSMEEWYKNILIKQEKDDENKVNYYSKSQVMNHIYDASAMLDYELMRAFLLELYLKKYVRNMIKRHKWINRFSR